MNREQPSSASEHEAPRAQTPRLSMAQMLLLVVVFFFLGPLAISNLWGYSQSRTYLTEAAFRNIRNVAALEASETLEFVRAVETLVPSIVKGNQHLFSIMRGWAATNDATKHRVLSHVLHKHLFAKAQGGSAVEEFYVLSKQGFLAASSRADRDPGTDLSNSLCFNGGKQSRGILGFDYRAAAVRSATASGASDAGAPAALASDSGVPRMIISEPIYDSNEVFLGTFCARSSFEIHRKLMMAHRARTNLAMLYLLDADGRIVDGSFDDPSTAPLGEFFSSGTRPQLPARAPWEGRYELESGEEVLTVYSPIPILDWGIVVEAPVINALADLEQLKWRAMGASVLLGGVLLLCVFLIWRMAVLPLRALSQASEHMASGEPGKTVAPRGPTELVELASAFNRMSLGLKDSQDLLEARIAERTRELRESQSFLELLLDSIDQRVIVIDRELKIIKANAAAVRMHGRPLVGEQCCAALEGETEPSPCCPALRTIDTGKPVSEERSQRTINGLEPVHIETYPVLGADGKIESVVEIGRVVTAEKQLQLQMVHQEKMAAFGQLAAGIAHEIGNPIAAIQSHLQLAQDEPEFRSQTLDVVSKQVDRMDRILRQLVDFTRSRKDAIELASVNEVVEDVVLLAEHHPRARGVSLELALSENLPAARINEDHLVQVLLNLALNAVDSIQGAGTVTFETAAENGHVIVRVRDTGNGIPEAAREHIFEPFFSTKEAGRGTGLGLFVSKGMTEEMGGQLVLEQSSASGTVFAIRVSTAEQSN